MRYLIILTLLCMVRVGAVAGEAAADPLHGLSPEAVKNLRDFAATLNAQKERNEKIKSAFGAYQKEPTPENAKWFLDSTKDLKEEERQTLIREAIASGRFNPYALEPELLGGTQVVVLPQPKPLQRPGAGSGQEFVNVQPDPDVERLKRQVAELSYQVEGLKTELRKAKADSTELAKQLAAEQARTETLQKALEQLTKP